MFQKDSMLNPSGSYWSNTLLLEIYPLITHIAPSWLLGRSSSQSWNGMEPLKKRVRRPTAAKQMRQLHLPLFNIFTSPYNVLGGHAHVTSLLGRGRGITKKQTKEAKSADLCTCTWQRGAGHKIQNKWMSCVNVSTARSSLPSPALQIKPWQLTTTTPQCRANE